MMAMIVARNKEIYDYEKANSGGLFGEMWLRSVDYCNMKWGVAICITGDICHSLQSLASLVTLIADSESAIFVALLIDENMLNLFLLVRSRLRLWEDRIIIDRSNSGNPLYQCSLVFAPQVPRNFSQCWSGRNQSCLQEAIERVPSGHDFPSIKNCIGQVLEIEGSLRRAEQWREPEILWLDARAGGREPTSGENEDEARGSLRAGFTELQTRAGYGRSARRKEHGFEWPGHVGSHIRCVYHHLCNMQHHLCCIF